MRKAWLLLLLSLTAGSASGANHSVGIGVDCDFAGVCFSPAVLTINVGDTVTFFIYGDAGDLGQPHNVVADDGSFRCARGCDGEGGDGTPAGYSTQWSFVRTFTTSGIVSYHDEMSGASGVVVVRAATGFAIDPGISGVWYDPNQSGHGLFIEVLPDSRFYASWFAFNPAGTEQAWFTGVGTYSGNTATIEAQMPTGGRWIPNFDPHQVTRRQWGSLEFVFTDCNHGAVGFNSIAGYGSGVMNLTRLTQPVGLSCDAGTKATAPAPGWRITGSLNSARSGHTATLLGSGKVLVAGGVNFGETSVSFVANAEQYDPATQSWSVTGALNAPRANHVATRLQDGRVLIAGGSGPDPLRTAEIYDPATGAWRATGDLAVNHVNSTATLLPDGRVLLVGGTDGLNVDHTAELYDPIAGAWSAAARPMYTRNGHTATLLQDGRVLIAGGFTGDAAQLSDTEFPAPINAEVYDPVSNTWEIVGAPMITYGRTATLLPNGNVLSAGGFTVRSCDAHGCLSGTGSAADLYHPDTKSWSATANLSVVRDSHTSTLLLDGRVLLVGDGVPGLDDSTDIYDPVAETWSTGSKPNFARYAHTATLLPNGNVLIAGGSRNVTGGSAVVLDSAEIYSPAPSGTVGPAFTGTWYDPNQSGHGLFIEVLSDNRFYASWFAFNPAGTEQAWFTGVGTYAGSSATVDMQIPTGGRWIPNFDPGQIVRNAWGTLEFVFTDCNHGTVSFNSVAHYGSGRMDLTRLTEPAGLSCP